MFDLHVHLMLELHPAAKKMKAAASFTSNN